MATGVTATAGTTRGRSRLRAALRVTAAVFGAYAFAWGIAAFGSALGALAGLAPAEAVTAASLLALLVLPVAALWAFAVPRAVMGWVLLGGGGALMTGVACAVRMALP
ncbi:hypothetical protein [Azospirillum sp. TSO35-2]|uniref:hypothetical protein n=1 Tax=Azospirillum sp. TSO35-2 TaxID=716796 RepID=UPI000D60BBA5|nr:hypothetical protein [Azospirillum sp. TSO35-2]PWC35917.1 hypothetical protein TSO352_11910 [Azospirillum sp. TSO35-2]